MTCIVGYADGENVWMAGDSYIDFGKTFSASTSASKVIKRIVTHKTGPRSGQVTEHRGMLIASAGHYRLNTVSRNFPIPQAGNDDQLFMDRVVDSFADKLFVGQVGQMSVSHGGDNDTDLMPGQCLWGYQGRLCITGGDVAAVPLDPGFIAIGYGADIAMGALEILLRLDIQNREWEDRLLDALDVVAVHCPHVAEPFHGFKI